MVELYDQYQDMYAVRKQLGAHTPHGWLALQRNGYLHPAFNAAGTVTGRLASHRPNVQNFARDPEIRRFIKAPEGKVILYNTADGVA